MQSVPLVVVVVVVLFAETMARATRVGVGIAWTLPTCPVGCNDAFVVDHSAVFCVISTTIHGLCAHTIGRESRDRTVLQLSPLDVTRHTFEVGIVKPFKDA
jgi:hypothetical protein